jgi:hypothetical protein
VATVVVTPAAVVVGAAATVVIAPAAVVLGAVPAAVVAVVAPAAAVVVGAGAATVVAGIVVGVDVVARLAAALPTATTLAPAARSTAVVRRVEMRNAAVPFTTWSQRGRRTAPG